MARGQHKGLSEWVVTCFAVNVIMGSGFLGVPRLIIDTGWLLGLAVLVLVTVLQWVAACLLTETCARANALISEKDAVQWLSPTLVPLALQRSPEPDEAALSVRHVRKGPMVLWLPNSTSFELLMLCRLLLGRWAEILVGLSVLIYQFGTLWSFCDVFAAAMASEWPLPGLDHGASCDVYSTKSPDCIHLYHGWLFIFCTFMLLLAVLDLREQVMFQVAMTIARVLIIVVMVGSVLFASGMSDFGLPAHGHQEQNMPTIRPAGLSAALPVAVFCQLFQIGVPTLLQPLGRKRSFGYVFGAALSITLVLYGSLGVSTAYFFGERTRPSCNINWRHYHMRPVALAVSLFPAMDTFTVFPLNALFLSNNMMSAVLGSKWYKESVPRSHRIASRIMCSLPPVICAAFFPSLSGAIDFTGVVGIILPFIVTPILHMASYKRCCEHWDAETVSEAESSGGFRTIFSGTMSVMFFGVTGCFLLLYTAAAQV